MPAEAVLLLQGGQAVLKTLLSSWDADTAEIQGEKKKNNLQISDSPGALQPKLCQWVV